MADLNADLTELFASFRDAGLIVGGAQAHVICGGEVVADVAFGTDHLGRPLTTESYACSYCVSKVPVFLALIAAIDSGRISAETTIGEILPDANPWVGSATILETLSQRAGFSVLFGPVSRFVPSHLRRVAHQWLQPSDRAPRGTQHYSVSEVGWLAAAMLERLHGRHYAEAVPSVLTGIFGPGILPVATGELSVSYQPAGDGSTNVPLLNEATRAVRSQWNPSLGWYTSATGMARVGAAINEAWHGRSTMSRDLIRFATSPVAPAVYDPGLEREISFGLGFWTGLSGSAFGDRIGAAAFGHNAQGGTSYLLIDPERDLVIAGCFDLARYEDAKTGERRRPLVETILDAVDG